MKGFFGALQKINLGYSINRSSTSPTVLKNVPNKSGKLKDVAYKWKTSMIMLQVFVFDKTYHLVLKDSALMHPESAPAVHSRAHFFKVYSFVSCFLTVPLNRNKLKYGMTSEMFIWMIELGSINPRGIKGYFLVL